MGEPAPRGFQRHAFTVATLTFVSRVGGLARDACMSRFVGLDGLTSGFFFAFLVPNLFRRLFGEGALSAALIPEQTRLESRDPAAARRLVAAVLSGVALGLLAILLLAELVLAFVPSSSGEVGRSLLPITLMYMPLVCIAALGGAVLQVRGRFAVTAAIPVILNVCLIAAIMLAWWRSDGDSVDADQIHLLAWGVVVAGILQAGWTVAEVVRTNGRDATPIDARGRRRARLARRRVLHQALPMILGLGVLQLNTFLDGLIASWPVYVGPTILGMEYPLGEDSMATLSFASRLYEFPLGVFGIAIATAIFPQLAREVGERDRFLATVHRGLRLTLFLGIPASVGIVLVRREFTTVVLEGRAFDLDAVRAVVAVLVPYSVALWSYSVNQLLVRVFYAKRQPMTAVRIAMLVVCVNLVLNLAFVFGTSLGVAGLAISTAICAVFQTVLLSRSLSKPVGRIWTVEVVGPSIRMIVLASVMSLAVYGVGTLLPPMTETSSWMTALIRLGSLTTVGAAVYLLGAGALRMPELGWAVGRDRGR